ncbi:hypothetical protein BU17DRAFT_76795 [Hysterangium stoloniferum]|nr:hypothetical protein BU17DRAFT_76795 [Hysterangium stoloniferum]
MPSDAILQLVNNGKTLTKAVASSPEEHISKLAEKLYSGIHAGGKTAKKAKQAEDYTQEHLDRVAKCGRFPYRPSDLFLMVYSDVLDTLECDPWNGMVSPPLLASSGVIPLSIVSVIPDIMRHYRNLIANAETEVMIATNYWEFSYSSSLVHDALIELSKRNEGKPTKPVVKLIYDRGNPKQAFKNHQRVPPESWEAVGLPKKEEIPNIEFEVLNYHRPIMGTFHAKYMIVDRKIACLNSNNIQDRVNVEMMTHIEGPIVDAFYDMSLLSWSEALQPPLPLINGRLPDNESYKFGEENLYINDAGIQHTKPSAGPEAAEGFHPHILHKPHKPFPIAMVNRPPHGTPGHRNVDVPQNAAWLAAFRLAKKTIFIQTPTFNAEPVVKEILDACRRGVECTIYVDLGFNDGGEMLPFQGGTNSKVVAGMYKMLNEEQKQQYLKIYWYTAKDQDKPIDAAEKRRNCHVKFCTVDDQIAIQGNGNQDTQSWFHSQEINIMVDSPEMCKEWRAGLENNQNTALYGRIDKDGLWRDKNGTVLDSKAGEGGPGEILKGLLGAVARVQGKGGF